MNYVLNPSDLVEIEKDLELWKYNKDNNLDKLSDTMLMNELIRTLLFRKTEFGTRFYLADSEACINPKTGKLYGATSDKYKNFIADCEAAAKGRRIVFSETVEKAQKIVDNLLESGIIDRDKVLVISEPVTEVQDVPMSCDIEYNPETQTLLGVYPVSEMGTRYIMNTCNTKGYIHEMALKYKVLTEYMDVEIDKVEMVFVRKGSPFTTTAMTVSNDTLEKHGLVVNLLLATYSEACDSDIWANDYYNFEL